MQRFRQLAVYLIEQKKRLNKTFASHNDAKLQIINEQARLQQELVGVEENILNAQNQLHRADLFSTGSSYARRETCPRCFIDHNIKLQMLLLDHQPDGEVRYGCNSCRLVLSNDGITR